MSQREYEIEICRLIWIYHRENLYYGNAWVTVIVANNFTYVNLNIWFIIIIGKIHGWYFEGRNLFDEINGLFRFGLPRQKLIPLTLLED